MAWKPWKHVDVGETEPELFTRCKCGRFLGADVYEYETCSVCRRRAVSPEHSEGDTARMEGERDARTQGFDGDYQTSRQEGRTEAMRR
jgi:hypothetical protein